MRANLASLTRVRTTALRAPTHITIIVEDFLIFGIGDPGSMSLEIFIVYNDIFIVCNITLLVLIFSIPI